MTHINLFFRKLQKKNIGIVLLVTLIGLGDRFLLLLVNTKNLHRLPLPSLENIQLEMAFLTLILLLFYFYQSESFQPTEIRMLTFLGMLLVGIQTAVFLVQNSIIAPYLNLITIFFHLVTFYAVSIHLYRLPPKFPNFKGILTLSNLGLTGIFLTLLFETVGLTDFAFLLLFGGTMSTLLAGYFFSTTVIFHPYQKNQMTNLRLGLTFGLPIVLSVIAANALAARQLTVQIVTSSLTQTLRLTIFRELPGITVSVQTFFLVLILGAIFLGIAGIISLYTYTKNNKIVLCLIGLFICGLEIVLPYINLLRLIAINELARELTNLANGKDSSIES